ncbi:ABC transporter G family member 22 [Hondaea fermentalgiana]|uniref:ABC transporter G family member 22 n=1 Tax=Hondaea fermentalgiana TaxID=2315210 RepID=A0A2R5GKJ5_9STRA|nr:ABC transporter G family member 22 [Hondaea fermentalgiana]|eukprot:GBG30839.1 ABC transporter G family member 22 [Hondaea fermentalgiana]
MRTWAAATIVAAATVAATIEGSRGDKCTAAQQLELEEIDKFNKTLYNTSDLFYDGDATCADGSPIGFYYGEASNSGIDEEGAADFIIWLGDSPMCSGTDCDELCDGTGKYQETTNSAVCAGYSNEDFFGGEDFVNIAEDGLTEELARCLFSRVVCTSSWWDAYPRVTPQTLLCPDDPDIAKFRRVYVPTCTLDWWMGNGTSASSESTSSDREFRHRGHRVLRNVLMELAWNHNLTMASRVMIGGTRGAAIGVMNMIEQIKIDLDDIHAEFDAVYLTTPKSREVFAVLDSPWFFNIEEFTPETDDASQIFAVENLFRTQSVDWIDNGILNSECVTNQDPGKEWRCFLPGELLKTLEDTNVLVLQSQFDLLHLELLGLMDEDKREFYVDDTSFASSAISYIETFGELVREDVVAAAALSSAASAKHHYFLPACGQHGYIVPTSNHRVQERTEEIKGFGTVDFQRDFEVWETVSIQNNTSGSSGSNAFVVRDMVKSFLASNGEDIGAGASSSLIADTCGSFLCNDKCLTEVEPFKVATDFSSCVQYMVLAYGIMSVLIFHVGFALSYAQVRAFRKNVTAYWKRIKLIDSGDNEQGVREVQQQLLNEASSTEYRKIHLMVKNLSYWAPPRFRREKPHRILHEVDLSFAPGSLHAIMGPSGSGKSTLLDLLTLTRDTGAIAGQHYINGVSSDSKECKFLRQWLRHNTSYVRQTDVIFPLLTVREHLVHAAWMMLPQYMPAEAKLRRVWQVIRLLELSECADTICGDGGVSVEGGISGGQRRRVSVATQLLKLPAVLLLDEPTSGLDSTNALLLIKSLHVMAHEASVNVMMTIHQPRREIFEYFDSLSFLVAGRVVFSGDAAQAAEHFRIPDSSTNIANDILDLLQTASSETVQEFEDIYLDGDLGEAVQASMEAEIADLTPGMLANLKAILVENALAEGRWSWSESSSAATLAWVHLARSMRRGGFEIFSTTALSLVGGVIVGTVFYDIDTYTSRTALSYLAVATMTFIQGTFLGDRYLGEKRMYDHEADAGTFRSWVAFLLSQFMRDAVTSTFEALAFAAPVYWLGGMNPALERFGLFLLIMTLTSFVVLCQNVLIEIDRDDVRVAAMLQIGVLGLGALFNGFIVKLDDLPVYLSWVPYTMVTYWSFVATLINDLSGESLPCDLTRLECAARTGDVVLRSLSYDNRDVYICILILIVFVFVFRILAVVDFYVRYVRKRGDRLKRKEDYGVGSFRTGSSPALIMNRTGSRASRSGTPNSRLTPGSKNTMGAMLETQTPTMKRQESSTTKNSGLSTPRTPYAGASPQIPVSMFDLSGPPPGSQPPHMRQYGQQNDDLPEMELGYYDEEHEQLSFVMNPTVAFFLDRNVFLLFFLLDFYSSVYICGFEVSTDGTNIGLLVASLGTSVIYVGEFFFQLFFLIPTTLDGKLDCTWYGARDAMMGLLMVIDVALTSQATATSSDFVIQIILGMVVRLTRFLRVLLYWNKVDHYHQATALSFLELKDELIEEVAQNQGRRISGFDSAPAPTGPASMRRPPRPQRRRSPHPTQAYESAETHVPAVVRMQAGSRISIGGARRISLTGNTPASNRPSRPMRPARPARPGATTLDRATAASRANATANAPGSLWRPAGNGYYYNSATGQMLSINQLAQRRAPPPPPPSRPSATGSAKGGRGKK